ncbi:hypothetical protein NT6N_08160 [Oceaniferula spumae]|uniref:DUF2254 domain-containing protein n=1 Tax=Oceaniferula spumae TaxID=2979115 RepID=A0AAT9FIJ1_9BACT
MLAEVKVQIARFLNRMQMSFWFIPGMVAVCAMLAGYGAQKLDLALYGTLEWELTDAAGARAILTTVAGSSITVAGVVFSITMVVLSSASSQYGPRLMRNFIRQPQTKWVLGGYIGTFIYCLMVAATIRDGEYGWVPQVSVTAGGVFGVLSFGLLIAFINHVTTFLQASQVINDVASRLYKTLEVLFPLSALSKEQRDAVKPGTIPQGLENPVSVKIDHRGFIQAINIEPLLKQATEHDAVLRIHFKPGDYVLPGQEVALLWQSGETWEDVEDDVKSALLLGSERTDDQDAEFAVDQLVEVAVRALSSGINDPFTAINCIRILGGMLAELDERGLPGGVIHDDEGKLRIATQTYTYAGFLDAAFNQIRQNSRNVESVSITLIDTLARLKERAISPEFATELKRHADLLKHDVENCYTNQDDLADFMERYDIFSNDDD